MASLWYCCGCNFGPHNSSLYDSCIQCGRTRCARCVGEFNVTPEGSPPPNICDSCDQEHKGQAPQHAIENNKGGETDGTSRAKKDPSVPTALLRSTKYVFGFFPRRTRPTIPGTPREISLSSQPSYPAIPLQRESAEYILYSASLGSLMTHWIYEQSFCGAISSNQVQTLEAVLVEWKSTQPEILYTESNNKTSFWNSFKGILETLTGGVLDWRPFGPYRTPLVQGQTRICWECPCGDPRWVVVPQSFALKIEEYSRTNAAPPDGSNDPVYSRSLPGIAASAHGSGEGAKSQINSGQASGSNHSGSRAQCRSLENGQKLSYQLHAFLVLVNFSIFGSTHCLAQTAVHDMSDDEFFTWIRTSYYSHRGFLATWFGLYKYAHCEFFRVSSHEANTNNLVIYPAV
ncbi:unnamed protein product [Penicillium egyptiacum]|uniref:Uncharacterized protein n=1 Tax=Penicillium egyptiacum TaxID=1303716 RepID=A0A9W4KRH1_9EURO|nr:unnamed protein product [Penicillium egyptiacum]